MEKLRVNRKLGVLGMLSVFLSFTSFTNQAHLGAITEAQGDIAKAVTHRNAVAAWTPAAIAAGVALYAGAVYASYQLGQIIGQAAYDMFGESYVYPESLEEYSPMDFSKFDS